MMKDGTKFQGGGPCEQLFVPALQVMVGFMPGGVTLPGGLCVAACGGGSGMMPQVWRRSKLLFREVIL